MEYAMVLPVCPARPGSLVTVPLHYPELRCDELERASLGSSGPWDTDRAPGAGPEDRGSAEIADRLRDLGHDVKNMLTASTGGAETLQTLLDEMFAELDVALSGCGDGELRGKVRQIVSGPRELVPELSAMVCWGLEAVRERTSGLGGLVKGAQAPPEFQWVRVDEIAERVHWHLAVAARRAEVELALEIQEGLPSAELDDLSVYSAVYNLVDNALSVTPPGGRVTVSLRAVSGSAAQDGDELEIEVADTGPGLSVEGVFNLVSDPGLTTKPNGSGRGLTIVKKTVDHHAGRLTVTTTPGAGTSFTLHLPLRRGTDRRPPGADDHGETS